MGTPAAQKRNRLAGWAALRQAAFISLALVLGVGAAWAKASRYDTHALPSPHFSTSVKVARVLFHNSLGEDAQPIIAANCCLPGPDWSGIAPLPVEPVAAGTPPAAFQSPRAPPALA